MAPAGGTLDIRVDKADGPVLGRIEVSKGSEWQTASVAAQNIPAGVHNLIVTDARGGTVNVDWVSFR